MSCFLPVGLPQDLMPVFRIRDEACFLDTPELAAVLQRESDETVRSLPGRQDRIVAALDRLSGAL